MIELCMRPLVVHRYHATRTLAAQYQSPVVTMMLEVGNRSEESQLAWKRLHRLAQSAAWTSAGCYLRHERLQLSTSRTTTGQSLGEEIDADHQAVMCLKLGNDGNFCYMNTVVQCIVHLCCLLGDSRLFFKDEARQAVGGLLTRDRRSHICGGSPSGGGCTWAGCNRSGSTMLLSTCSL